MYLDINEYNLIACPLRKDAAKEEDKFVTDEWCAGCEFHAEFLRGGGGAAGMAPIGANPTKVDCRFEKK